MKTAVSAVALLLLFSAPAGAADSVPVVFAVDTSRSLTAANLEEIGQTLAAATRQLPADTPLGLIAFNDEARWLAPLGTAPDALAAALAAARPEGSFTVLHDALFLAGRELPDGGVILVVTDGRDENSATTVDDVARLCETQQVRILTGGVGRLDDRALRRFALLSRGEYLGPLGASDPATIAAALETARDGIATDLALTPPSARQSTSPRSHRVQETSTTQQPEAGARGLLTWVYALGALALVLLLVVALVIVAIRRKAPALRVCERCGSTMESWETACSTCQISELEQEASSQKVAEIAVADEAALDPEVFEKAPILEDLDQTMVLNEQPMLITKQRGKPPRTYVLPHEQAFAVGRAPDVNTLQLEDPTVSAQHFKVVPKDGEYYVVDLGTTNGTSVNHERVTVRKLAPGDVITVGMVDFEFRMKLRRMA